MCWRISCWPVQWFDKCQLFSTGNTINNVTVNSQHSTGSGIGGREKTLSTFCSASPFKEFLEQIYQKLKPTRETCIWAYHILHSTLQTFVLQAVSTSYYGIILYCLRNVITKLHWYFPHTQSSLPLHFCESGKTVRVSINCQVTALPWATIHMCVST